jgi:putative sterol carrier protein
MSTALTAALTNDLRRSSPRHTTFDGPLIPVERKAYPGVLTRGWVLGDATEEFFKILAARGHEPLLHGVTGTMRIDLSGPGGGRHWHVAIDRGDVSISHRRAKADTELRADEGLFDRMVSGEVNGFAAALRGEVVVEGEPALALAFQRLFPGPGSTFAEPSERGRGAAGHSRSRR